MGGVNIKQYKRWYTSIPCTCPNTPHVPAFNPNIKINTRTPFHCASANDARTIKANINFTKKCCWGTSGVCIDSNLCSSGHIFVDSQILWISVGLNPKQTSPCLVLMFGKFRFLADPSNVRQRLRSYQGFAYNIDLPPGFDKNEFSRKTVGPLFKCKSITALHATCQTPIYSFIARYISKLINMCSTVLCTEVSVRVA